MDETGCSRINRPILTLSGPPPVTGNNQPTNLARRFLGSGG